MKFEDDLRRALRPEEAPEGFEERLRARLAERQALPIPVRRSGWPGIGGWVAAAASVLALAAGGWYYESRQTEDEGVRAARDVRMALQIASEKLSMAERRVNRFAQP
jgi:hypothetical protein